MTINVYDAWYPVAFSHQCRVGDVQAISLMGEPLVLFRDQQGKVACLQDRCPHRSTPLSLGRVEGSTIQCRYHGWCMNHRDTCLPNH